MNHLNPSHEHLHICFGSRQIQVFPFPLKQMQNQATLLFPHLNLQSLCTVLQILVTQSCLF